MAERVSALIPCGPVKSRNAGSMAAVGCLLGKPKQVVSFKEIIRKQLPASSPFLKPETAAPSFE